jgi:catechol 2,3-dioxygenase-like lactoylglutathione lyase family enzyme
MKIEAVDHFTINVLDANESLRFYGEVLGLPRLPSVRMADHDLYYFQLGPNSRLELIEYDNKIEPKTLASETLGIYRHLALRVSNIFQWAKHLHLHGVQVTSEPVWVPTLLSTNMLIKDSNGVEIEMIER